MKRRKGTSKEVNIHEFAKDQKRIAKEMALKAQEKIKGKRLVPHPTAKNAYIYV